MAARYASTWRPCTATSRASGSTASMSWPASPNRATGRSGVTTWTPSSASRMVAATTQPVERQRLLRFDAAERALHWVNAALFLTVMGTAAILYVGGLSAAVGRRELVRQIHVWCGIALPVPVLVTVAGRWGRAFRADISRLNRWTKDDRRWFRSF